MKNFIISPNILQLLLLLLLFTPMFSRAGTISDIPARQQVILATVKSYNDAPYSASTWIPTREQTTKCLKALRHYLERQTKGVSVESWQDHQKAGGLTAPEAWEKVEMKKILTYDRAWRVQFWGVISSEKTGSRKLVHCNFFPAATDTDEFPHWREQPAEVCDGGYFFWQADCDSVTGECTVSSNGYAQQTGRPSAIGRLLLAAIAR